MRAYYWRNFSPYRRETIGFALFLAWLYCSLFGCGLATHDATLDGTFTTYNLERIWMVSGLFEAVGGLAGLTAARFIRAPEALVRSRAFGAGALAFAVTGNLLTWFAWTDRMGELWLFHVPGGALTGLAVALFAMIWADRLSSYDEAHVEFAVPLSFTIAFALYCGLLFAKRGSIPFLVLVVLMIAASCWFACRKHAPTRASKEPRERKQPRVRHGLLSFGLLVCMSWVQVAFFRVLSTPSIMGNRFTHFLIPFSCACLLSLAMLMLCMRMSRYLNISLSYRWSLPLFMLSYVPVLIDYGNPTLRLVGYSINFLGMFGVQFGCWLGACKYLRRAKGDALRVFGGYALGEGLGIFAGCAVGLFAVQTLENQEIMVLALGLLTAVVFVVMVTGFNPNWIFNRTRSIGGAREFASVSPEEADGRASVDIDAAFEREARVLQQDHGLTNRETDVAALLLAGRSRPFIRDELTVSINTVSSHVRSIFSKCGVHSQQELMDLARTGKTSRQPVAPRTAANASEANAGASRSASKDRAALET